MQVMVRRRYTDFVALYDSVRRRYRGLIPPSVPPKKTFFNSSQGHIMERMRAAGVERLKMLTVPGSG